MPTMSVANPVPTAAPDRKKSAELKPYQFDWNPNGMVALESHKAVNGIQPTHPGTADFSRVPHARVYHPKQAPSAIASENFLAARSSMNPGFIHNVAQTNIARISNLYKDVPRFRSEVDILA